MSDLRNALRALQTTPVATIISILSLALGIGANTAVFSIADSLLLRSLPVERPDRLALLVPSEEWFHQGYIRWNYPLWSQIRERRHELFQTAFAFRSTRFNLARRGQTDFVDGLWASGEYFDALGVQPMMGRTFTAEDDARGGGPDGPVAVISYAFWQRRFGGAPDIVGRVQTIERVPFTIVGVMPRGFFGTEAGSAFDIAVPLGTETLIRGRESALNRTSTWWLKIMARLKEGQTLASAERILRSVQPQIREATLPSDASAEEKTRYLTAAVSVKAGVLGTSEMRDRYQQPIFTVMTVVMFVLLIACANIANLLLARAAARRHELSVRLALGASRWRLARQMLVESFLISGGGAIVGLGIAKWSSPFLVHQLSTQATTVFLDVQLDWRVLLFTSVIAVAAAFLFGTAPALRAASTQPMEAIRERRPARVGGRRVSFGHGLVSAQVALSLVLVVFAGLFERTLASLATMDLGFDRDPVLIVKLDVEAGGQVPSQRTALYEQIAEAVRAIPGVSHAALSDVTPVSGWVLDVEVEIDEGPPLTLPQNVSFVNTLTPGWFATYGTRIVAGRDFDDRDRITSPPVAIVNETFVRKFLQGGPPIGRRIRNVHPSAREQSSWMEVVGVVTDATYRSLRDPVPPTMYLPMAQQPEAGPSMSLSVRAANGAAALLVGGVAEAIGGVDSDIAFSFTPLKQQVDDALVQERILAMLSGFFGALALMLAGLGLYGVASYAVSSRRREIGIRMALGATGRDIVRVVLLHVGLLVGVGLLAGMCISIWTWPYVEALLYGVTPHDTTTLFTASVMLAAVAVLASWLPARSAACIEPARILREE